MLSVNVPFWTGELGLLQMACWTSVEVEVEVEAWVKGIYGSLLLCNFLSASHSNIGFTVKEQDHQQLFLSRDNSVSQK